MDEGARFPLVAAKAGHYESFYVKACRPGGGQGIWIRAHGPQATRGGAECLDLVRPLRPRCRGATGDQGHRAGGGVVGARRGPGSGRCCGDRGWGRAVGAARRPPADKAFHGKPTFSSATPSPGNTSRPIRLYEIRLPENQVRRASSPTPASMASSRSTARRSSWMAGRG